MVLHISINDKDISAYGLIAIEGTLNAFMTPPTLKKLVKNENSAINGTQYVAISSRKVNERTFNVPFLMKSPSLIDQQRNIKKLSEELEHGVDGIGINKVFVKELETTYYLIYDDYTNFSCFGTDGDCRINIKFIEPNPKNREQA